LTAEELKSIAAREPLVRALILDRQQEIRRWAARWFGKNTFPIGTYPRPTIAGSHPPSSRS
jgi:hypothetical protein